MGYGGYDGFTAMRDRLPQYECKNCRKRLTPPVPKHCPQCGIRWGVPIEHAPRIYRKDQRNCVGWTPSRED